MDAPTSINAGNAQAKPPAVAMVAVAVRGVSRQAGLPGPGELLRVCPYDAKYWFRRSADSGNLRAYRGSPAMELTDNPGGRPVGVVWTRQPQQTLARRGIALVAVVTGGSTTVPGDTLRRASGAPALVQATATSTEWIAGYWSSQTQLCVSSNPTAWLSRKRGTMDVPGFPTPADALESDGAFWLFEVAYKPVLREVFNEVFNALTDAEKADYRQKLIRENVADGVLRRIDTVSATKTPLRPNLVHPLDEPFATWHTEAQAAVKTFIVDKTNPASP